MSRKQAAFDMGVEAGADAVRYNIAHLSRLDYDEAASEAHDAEMNARQYWTSDPFRAEDEWEEEALLRAYEEGVSAGIENELWETPPFRMSAGRRGGSSRHGAMLGARGRRLRADDRLRRGRR